MKIAIASDHAGFEMKKKISELLTTMGHQVLDFGTYSNDPVDYPDFAVPAAEAVASTIADMGILICGSGIGMAIVANKVQGIRAANCTSVEMARLARKHNNANILTLGSRLLTIEQAEDIIRTFLSEDFEGGRHMIRIEKIHRNTGR
ncbi:MAG TPA: ribose 5-phosphate isomerase B [Bacteroidota bacterium]|nr:ribose 5-phosphate isomerase B [Candidatus Kapabacteria bacterium]HRS01585.1 ribose 5-phosphate isomerase B [Bacteroidota bacterium]HRT67396.1 ribose 5-phosphate isomerase B [Bacteroidota bacterium]